MSFTIPQFAPAMAEIALATGICIVLLADLFISKERKVWTLWLALATLAATAWFVGAGTEGGSVLTFDGSFVADGLARVLKLFTLIVVAIVFVYSHAYLQDRDLLKGEYYLLGLFAVLGMFVMISAHSLLTMYLGLELMSLALYAMTAFDRNSPVAAEAALKYFVLGAIASGILLYGMSLLYGVTGSLQLDEIGAALAGEGAALAPALLGTAFVIVGIAFKFGAVPFHNWVPDLYQGAPTSVTLFIGTAPKLAAFAMLTRLLDTALGPIGESWAPLVMSLGVLSIALGNVIAIAQTNIKRMLAYSTIGHFGFMLTGFAVNTPQGQEAALFYTLVYSIMAAAAFGMILLLARRGFEAEELDDFRGLNARSPWFAAMMLLVMASMIGIPPFVGFFAKLYVLAALVEADLAWVAIIAVLFSVIGAFYYLRVIRYMYFEKGEDESPVEAGLNVRLLLSANALAMLGLGVFANPLLALCAAALA